MPNRIEDYALIGNCQTAALVGRDGSIDWLCVPRFDSAACFAALLGTPDHGRWLIAPQPEPQPEPGAGFQVGPQAAPRVTRRYRPGSLVLETTFETDEGTVCLIDCMTRHGSVSEIARVVRGVRGRVTMQTELVARFEYGSVVPWVSRQDDGRLALVAGPNRLLLDSPIELRGEHMRTRGEFTVAAGEEVGFTLSWSLSYRPAPSGLAAAEAIANSDAFWADWRKAFKPEGEWSDQVLRSLITLKALAHHETGGIVAAATTSLPEQLGGPRNWDYRYCWLRDATFTLYALTHAGFLEEAQAWRGWLVRAVAGSPDDLQIMYGLAGERRLTEFEVPWLPGHAGSTPVRIGNAAAGQIQLDVYGEVLDALYVGRHAGLEADDASWDLECALIAHLETIWDQPDEGIWEVRGGRRQFTHSKVMAWVAFDRAVRSAEEFAMEAPLERWRNVRDAIHQQVCEMGFNTARDSFVQYYGGDALDASLLLIPLVGFLPADDPRVTATIAAIERELLRDGLVLRYDTGTGTDGLPPGEGAFLACSFWLVDNYLLQGRHDEARALFRQLLGICNDVGLLAEEYDPVGRRQLGNFPQAFSHLALINTAQNFHGVEGPAQPRSKHAHRRHHRSHHR